MAPSLLTGRSAAVNSERHGSPPRLECIRILPPNASAVEGRRGSSRGSRQLVNGPKGHLPQGRIRSDTRTSQVTNGGNMNIDSNEVLAYATGDFEIHFSRGAHSARVVYTDVIRSSGTQRFMCDLLWNMGFEVLTDIGEIEVPDNETGLTGWLHIERLVPLPAEADYRRR